MPKQIFLSLLIIFVILSLTSCNLKTKAYESTNFAMGTVITQKIYGKNAPTAAREVIQMISRLERMLSLNLPDSEVNQLNHAAGKNAVALSTETITLLDHAMKISSLSHGAFDITVGPLVKAWQIGTEQPQVPDEVKLTELLKLVDYHSLTIQGKQASLKKPGQVVDLGGIAKGYAGDLAKKIYAKHKVTAALLNLGGNVVTFGSKPDGKPWQIGIQDPRGKKGSYLGIVSLSPGASMVTSGDYERFFERDGVRYHHLLDPKTGRPANSGLISTTIISNSSTDADGLSTATFVLGLKSGRALLSQYQNTEAVFITNDYQIHLTPNLKKVFQFTDESGRYHVQKR